MFRPLAVVIVRPLLAATVVAGGAVALAPAAQAALGQGSAYALSGPLQVRNGTNWDTGTNVRAGTNWDDGTNWDGGTNWDDGTHWDT